MSEDCHSSENTQAADWSIVKYEPQPEIVWTLEDLQFLYSIGVSHE